MTRSSLPSLAPLAAALLLPLAACGGDAAAAGPTVRDSAGISIVQNEVPAWRKGHEWRVSAEPVTDVGVADGDPNQQFARVSHALRLSGFTIPSLLTRRAVAVRVRSAARLWRSECRRRH